jgi:hypothetical protein
MKIKKISLITGMIKESTICDCCGRSISNIYYITLADDSHLRLGTTCFEKQVKNLDKMAKKKVNHSIKMLKWYEEMLETWKNLTEDECKEQFPGDYERIGRYEDIDTFEDLKKWNVNEFFPYRINLEEENIAKYAKLS